MATLAEKLAEAEAAYHELMMGRAARVVVDSSGERVEFNVTSAPRLKAYIEDLKREIAAGGKRRCAGPAGALF